MKEGFEKGITHEYYKTHVIFHSTTTKEYYSRLVRWPGVEEEMISALNTAFEVADDASKVRIGFIRDIVLASLEAIP